MKDLFWVKMWWNMTLEFIGISVGQLICVDLFWVKMWWNMTLEFIGMSVGQPICVDLFWVKMWWNMTLEFIGISVGQPICVDWMLQLQHFSPWGHLHHSLSWAWLGLGEGWFIFYICFLWTRLQSEIWHQCSKSDICRLKQFIPQLCCPDSRLHTVEYEPRLHPFQDGQVWVQYSALSPEIFTGESVPFDVYWKLCVNLERTAETVWFFNNYHLFEVGCHKGEVLLRCCNTVWTNKVQSVWKTICHNLYSQYKLT